MTKIEIKKEWTERNLPEQKTQLEREWEKKNLHRGNAFGVERER